MAEESTPTVHTERNKILGGLAELSFHDAIVAVDERAQTSAKPSPGWG